MDFVEYIKKPGVSENSKVNWNEMYCNSSNSRWDVQYLEKSPSHWYLSKYEVEVDDQSFYWSLLFNVHVFTTLLLY